MSKKSSLKVVILGGLNEVGKNIMVLEKDNSIIVIDCGIMFPDDYLPGIDYLIPDFSYLKKNSSRIKALIFSHGHEDHIGALPYLFREIGGCNAPIYATKLTLGLIKLKINDNQINEQFIYNEINTDERLRIGPFNIEFFRVNHSIPDGVGMIIRTDIGTLVHTGDFKFDQYPIDGRLTEFAKIAEAGKEGVLALFCDSTNAEEKGYTLPERDVGKTLYEKFNLANKRIIVATFSSHVHRIQQVLDVAKQLNKKVAIAGRTMLKTFKIATELGYLKVPADTIIPITKINEYPLNRIVLLSTGSQGEPLSALRKMALKEHTRVQIMKEDMVIISASPIPGNENAISSTINLLLKQGADVFYESIAGVHVSGHAAGEEIKMMLNLVKPKYFIPIHGEPKHRIQASKLAAEVGMPATRVIMAQNGDVLKLNENLCKISNNLTLQNVYIDGFGYGNTEDIVLKDRKTLSRNGIVFISSAIDLKSSTIVAEPDFVLKGIIYIESYGQMIAEAKRLVTELILGCFKNNLTNISLIEANVSENVEKFILKKIRVKPIIITKIINISSN